MKKLIIAVDFDGTIVENHWPYIGPIQNYSVIALRFLHRAGHKLILWTCREGERLENAVNYCKELGIEFDGVNANVDSEYSELGDSRKVHADIYIDDKCYSAHGKIDWFDILYRVIDIQLKKTLWDIEKIDAPERGKALKS